MLTPTDYLRRRRTTQLSSRGGAGSYGSRKAYTPPRSAAAPGSASGLLDDPAPGPVRRPPRRGDPGPVGEANVDRAGATRHEDECRAAWSGVRVEPETRPAHGAPQGRK